MSWTQPQTHSPMFAPNTRMNGAETRRFEALLRMLIRGPCTCKERVVFAGFPIINGVPHVHRHNALVHNRRCPVHGVEGTEPIEWHI